MRIYGWLVNPGGKYVHWKGVRVYLLWRNNMFLPTVTLSAGLLSADILAWLVNGKLALSHNAKSSSVTADSEHHTRWAPTHSAISLISVAEMNDNVEQIKRDLLVFLYHLRLPAEVFVLPLVSTLPHCWLLISDDKIQNKVKVKINWYKITY